MPTRLFVAAALAALCVLVASESAEACHKRSVSYAVQYLPHCPPVPCPCPGPVYVVSPPSVPLYGADPEILRIVPLGKGVIVEFTVNSGTKPEPLPTGDIVVTKTGGEGEIKYTGYNKRHEYVTMPGAPNLVYSVFLLPTKAGKVTAKVDFKLADGTTKSHTLGFDVKQVIGN